MAKIKLKNFAKIKSSDFDIKDITVFVGKPSTGKSYVMKFLYAYFEVINLMINNNNKMNDLIFYKDEISFLAINFLLKEYNIKNIDTIMEYIKRYDFINALEMIKSELRKNKNNFISKYPINILEDLANKQEKFLRLSDNDKFIYIFRNILQSIFENLSQISDNFEACYENTKIIYENNKFTIENIDFNKNNGAIFVETPLILEFQKFLPKERFSTPYHIDSLLQELNKKDYSFVSDDENIFINEFKKISSNIIEGDISKDERGFSFNSKDGKNFNIVNTSSGVKSIGLLQYLVSNKTIKKGSILFWEEPEVHLHPVWQLKMVDLFIELMKNGVKILFSTHSPLMPDYLNAKAKKGGFSNRVSFNLLQKNDNVVDNIILNNNTWDLLQSELLDPLEEVMWEY